MEPADGEDPLVRVTWHIEESLLRWLSDQSRESGVPKARIARRLLAEGMVRQVTGRILPVPDGLGDVGIMAPSEFLSEEEKRGRSKPVATAGTEEVGAVPGPEMPPKRSRSSDGDGVVDGVATDRPPAPAPRPEANPARAKARHHDDAVVGGGALVKCRRCSLVKNAARPEVCDA